MKNILFICRHNVFRSKVAEAYFKKINKNSNIYVSSSGLIPSRGLQDVQVEIAKTFGIEILSLPKPTIYEDLKKQDLVIVVANDISKDFFDRYDFLKGKVIFWEIEDIKADILDIKKDKEINVRIIKKIMGKVKELNGNLSNILKD